MADPKPKSIWNRIGHGLLDAAGMAPVFGNVADGINASWYAAEGDTTNAALSAAGAIPGVGMAVIAGKYGNKIKNLFKHSGQTSKINLKNTGFKNRHIEGIDGPSGSYVKNDNSILSRDYDPNNKEIKNVFVDKNKSSKIYRVEDVNQGTPGSKTSGLDWFDEIKHNVTKGYYNKYTKNALDYGKKGGTPLIPSKHPRRVTAINVTENYKNAQRAGGNKLGSKLSGGDGNLPLYNEIITDKGLMSRIRTTGATKAGVIKNNPNSVAKTFIGPKVQVEKLYDNPLFLKKNGKT